MCDELHNRTQQTKENLTTFAYEIQRLLNERSPTVRPRYRNTSLLANLSKALRNWTLSEF
nr:unnamed protein product [Callosobruchus chinensis]